MHFIYTFVRHYGVRWILCAAVALCVSAALWRWRPWRPVLTVWSCGGNAASLRTYVRRFERENSVRMRYTAAPVTYLLEQAATGPRRPDVLVGRGGPGWLALEASGRLRHGPVFFALDPLVIAVASGNPKDITGPVDLGRPDVRVSQSPGAMRPKGKVPGLLMAAASKRHPGLVERWEANTVVRATCGRDLLQPLIDGTADAAVAPRSLLTYAGDAHRLDAIPIDPGYILAMKRGRPSMPQCAGTLHTDHGQAIERLADAFVAGLTQAPAWLRSHGYVPLDAPEARPLKPLLTVMAPRDMPSWQTFLAARLADAGILREARRRYLKVITTFGPNHFTARAHVKAGELSQAPGATTSARHHWTWTRTHYPPPPPVEYDCGPIATISDCSPMARRPYDEWVDAARELLAATAHDTDAGMVLDDPRVRALFPVTVRDSDPPKNGKREFALGLHLFVAGDLDYATRDLLKVVTLNHPSTYCPDAEYLLGVCAERRGHMRLAAEQWQRACRRYPGTPAADAAAAKLVGTSTSSPQGTPDANATMPAWTSDLTTHPARGMAYGMRLYEHRLPLFTCKEMWKIAAGIYGPNTLGAEPRYRAGICAADLGYAEAARLQWRLCSRLHPESTWTQLADERLAAHPTGAEAAPPEPVVAFLRTPADSGPKKRWRLAQEFRFAQIRDEGQMLMEYLKVATVARPRDPASPLPGNAETQVTVLLENRTP